MYTERFVGSQLRKAENELINEVIHGDCLKEALHIESGSVDLILTDLPYGNMKNAPSTWDAKKTTWDTIIDPQEIYKIANRILRKNGKMVLFSQEPYTTTLISQAISSVPFSYRAIWEKDTFANALGVNKNMVGIYEDILVFSKNNTKLDFEKSSPLREILAKYVERYGKEYIIDLFEREGRYKSPISARVHASYKFGYTNGSRVDIMSKDMYDYLSEHIEFEESHEQLKAIFRKHHEKTLDELNSKYPSTFNLWEGNKYKSNILRYKKDYDGYHPTQKPILLLEDLIKTFSNEGDTIVDLTAGSGSTLVAAANTGRNFIGIEKELEYVNVANNRIAQI